MTRKDKAATIRKDLKALGWSGRQVSVRVCRGSSIYVTVKDPTVSLHKVEKIAMPYQSVRRCEYSGEILSGGNTFITVEYDRNLVREKAAEVESLLSDEPGKPVTVAGFDVWKEKGGFSPGDYCICKAGGNLNANVRAYGRHSAAEVLAIAVMDGGFSYCGEWVGVNK